MRKCTFLFLTLCSLLACGAFAGPHAHATQTTSRPSDIVANGRVGAQVIWVGKQVRVSTTLKNGQRVITNRVFVLVDAQGKELRNEVFSVEGSVKESEAAQKLNSVRDDPGIRRVTGTISSVGDIEIYVNGKPGNVRGPRLADVILDVK